MKPIPTPSSQNGNVLFMILIAVVLFAALGYAVAEMMRGGNPDMVRQEKARVMAAEILAEGRTFRQAVQMLRISNGCGDTGMSFEDTALSGYTHSPAVADACKLFHKSGGGLVYNAPEPEALDLTITPAPALRGHWFFPADVCVPGTGTAATGAGCNADGTANEAVIAVLPYVQKFVCVEINEALGITNPGGNPPPETGNAWTAASDKFNGAQNDGERLDQPGLTAGCFEGDGVNVPPSGTYHFFQVLLVR